ncbi:hypothetical protein Q1695_005106 [Nippostrongylus brasiliensis]|nr:hypothetical protein Q1695_005106 [Nippostrongylus brasiliensis]
MLHDDKTRPSEVLDAGAFLRCFRHVNPLLKGPELMAQMHYLIALSHEKRTSENRYPEADFFVRSAKWIPSGGAGLVSGRGNFRPGFSGRDWRSALAEPSFNKRSSPDLWISEY